jgi:hypothetical protein
MSAATMLNKTELYGDRIYSLDHFLSQDECSQWISRAEEKGFNDSPPSGGGHGRTGGETPRTSQFVYLMMMKVQRFSGKKSRITCHLMSHT